MFWNGTSLDDPVMNSARLRCMAAEHRLNYANSPAEVDAAIHELNAAESEFNERLSEIRERFFHYGVFDWERSQQVRAGRRQRKTRRVNRSTMPITSIFTAFSRNREIAR